MAKDDNPTDSSGAPESVEKETTVKKEPVMNEKETVPAPADKGQGYSGKSSVLKWIVIYLIIGAVVYGAWYYFSKGRGSDATTSTTTDSLYQ
jgi:hypothetical protein